jgi:hypothetical protein
MKCKQDEEIEDSNRGGQQVQEEAKPLMDNSVDAQRDVNTGETVGKVKPKKKRSRKDEIPPNLFSITIDQYANTFQEHSQQVQVKSTLERIAMNRNDEHPPMVFVWRDLERLVNYISTENRINLPDSNCNLCPLRHPVNYFPCGVPGVDGSSPQPTAEDLKRAMIDWIRNHVDPPIPPEPLYNGVLSLTFIQGCHAASSLPFLCYDKWFVNMINASGQQLPLAHAVTTVSRRNTMVSVFAEVPNIPVRLWN